MRTGLPIVAAILTACGVTATNGTNVAESQPQGQTERPARQFTVEAATVRNFAEGERGGLLPDNEFRLRFASAAAARQAFGAASDALAAAGIRYQPARRQFRDGRRAYAPLILIVRGGEAQLLVRMNELDGGEVSLCQACQSHLGLVRAGQVADLGEFDNNGLGIAGSVHLLAQSGPVVVVGIQVGYYMQGESGASVSVRVLGERGVLTPEIPLLRQSGYDSSFLGAAGAEPPDRAAPEDELSVAMIRRRVRLEGDRLMVLYPDARPSSAVFRIGPSRLELIEGRVPAALTQN